MGIFYPYITRRKYSESEGINADFTWTVNTVAFGKTNSDVSPYLIANEWIAANIAWFLRLPVPPFSLLRKKTRKTVMFASYSFEGDSKPANAIPNILYATFPELCSGIVIFDILIANSDRHPQNIKVDNATSPTWLKIIDHERSMFHLYPKEGAKHLKSREGRLGLTDGTQSQQDAHCLISQLRSFDHIATWIARISEMPDWFIEDVCSELWKIAITKKECIAATSFLKSRRDKLGSLILNNKKRFPRIPHNDWPMFL